MAGLSARALHHYDAIGLLSPAERSSSGYRLYGAEELLRLQQVILYRELGLGLDGIRRILDEPGFDRIGALEAQARLLRAKAERLARLALTVDRTVGRLKGEISLSDEELYEGFAKDEVESIKREAEERWGATEAYAESRRRTTRMSGEDWARVKAEGAAVDEEAARAMREGAEPGSPRVRAVMARKLEHLRSFYEPSMEMFGGLGRLYEEDERFRRHYEDIAPGLASFMRKAMESFARA